MYGKNYSLNRLLAYYSYIHGIESNFKWNPKYFWDYLRSKRAIHSVPSKLRHDSNTAETLNEICEIFADFFESTYYGNGFQDLDGYSDFGTLSRCIDIGSLRLEVG